LEEKVHSPARGKKETHTKGGGKGTFGQQKNSIYRPKEGVQQETSSKESAFLPGKEDIQQTGERELHTREKQEEMKTHHPHRLKT